MKNNFLYTKNISFVLKVSRAGKLFINVLFLTLYFSFASVSAQPAIDSFNTLTRETSRKPAIDERVMLNTDREIYLCGENIVFNAIIYEGNWYLPVIMSSVLYVELYNQDNRVILKGKFFMKNGMGSGTIPIPRDIITDIYYIRAYTNYMKNFGFQQFFLQKLKIVNPFHNSTEFKLLPRSGNNKNIEVDSVNVKPVMPLERFEIDLKTDKKEYGNRENVEVIINARNNKGLPVKTNLVLFACLSNIGLKEDKKLLNLVLLSTPDPTQKASIENTLHYLPEMDGDIISGKLVFKDGKPATGVEILQSFIGSTSWIESSITDINGHFYFIIKNQKNKGDLILKVQNTDIEISVVLDDEFYSDFPPPSKDTLRFSEDEIDLISKQFINIQVDDAFPAEKQKYTENVNQDDFAFYGNEYMEYKFSDYAKLPNMKEFIFEVILGVVISRENKQDVIDILEENTLNKIGPYPLIIIDGVPVSESSIVTGLPSEKVQIIRVVRNKYFYKNQIFDGILDIITSTKDASYFELPKGTFQYNFLHAKEENSIIEPKLSSDEAGRIPLYKNLLYWNSNVTTDKDGKALASFCTPDNAGNFRIQCFGFTQEGLFWEGSLSITVGKF